MAVRQSRPAPDGILPFAKRPGPTSFSALWDIKHALETDKVGHTGTLDSFAEGLLVVLSGHLTHLVPHVTGLAKTYQAVVCFGMGTDTLDPGGAVTGTGPAPSREAVEAVLPKFCGALLQVPPVYSAVHVGGLRASDAARSGGEVVLEPRQVFVYGLELRDFTAPSGDDPCAYALLEVSCSKGTYIRALARDMAAALGTAAHLCALRRTAVGGFRLEDAACYAALRPFTIENGIMNGRRFASLREEGAARRAVDGFSRVEAGASIRAHFLSFTPPLAVRCGLPADTLLPDAERAYLNGRPLRGSMFAPLAAPEGHVPGGKAAPAGEEIAVFDEDGGFAGVVVRKGGRLGYGFVVPRRGGSPEAPRGLRVFTWDDVVRGNFPQEWRRQGTAIAVGGFDGMHAGHLALLGAVAAQEGLAGGLVTFRTPPRAAAGGYAGDVATLAQRLEIAEKKGLAFAIVIDFSPEFSRMEGAAFIRTLAGSCGLAFLAEGKDFRCGYGGSITMRELALLAEDMKFSLRTVDDVQCGGERVSSSRIRAAVSRADFGAAHDMLLRPFAYDCEGLVWREDGGWSRAARVTQQVLPPAGAYRARYRGEESAECVVEDGSIRLRLPEDEARRVRALEFL